MQEQARIRVVRIPINMIDTFRIERARPAVETVHFILSRDRL